MSRFDPNYIDPIIKPDKDDDFDKKYPEQS